MVMNNVVDRWIESARARSEAGKQVCGQSLLCPTPRILAVEQRAYWVITVPALSNRRRLGARPYSCSSVVEESLLGRPE